MLNNEILKFEKRRLNNIKTVIRTKKSEFKNILNSHKNLHESNKKELFLEHNKLKKYDRTFLEGERRTIIKRFIELKRNLNLIENIAHDEIEIINTNLQDSDTNFYNIVKEVKKINTVEFIKKINSAYDSLKKQNLNETAGDAIAYTAGAIGGSTLGRNLATNLAGPGLFSSIAGSVAGSMLGGFFLKTVLGGTITRIINWLIEKGKKLIGWFRTKITSLLPKKKWLEIADKPAQILEEIRNKLQSSINNLDSVEDQARFRVIELVLAKFSSIFINQISQLINNKKVDVKLAKESFEQIINFLQDHLDKTKKLQSKHMIGDYNGLEEKEANKIVDELVKYYNQKTSKVLGTNADFVPDIKLKESLINEKTEIKSGLDVTNQYLDQLANNSAKAAVAAVNSSKQGNIYDVYDSQDFANEFGRSWHSNALLGNDEKLAWSKFLELMIGKNTENMTVDQATQELKNIGLTWDDLIASSVNPKAARDYYNSSIVGHGSEEIGDVWRYHADPSKYGNSQQYFEDLHNQLQISGDKMYGILKTTDPDKIPPDLIPNIPSSIGGDGPISPPTTEGGKDFMDALSDAGDTIEKWGRDGAEAVSGWLSSLRVNSSGIPTKVDPFEYIPGTGGGRWSIDDMDAIKSPTTTGVSPFEYTQGGGRWSVDDMDAIKSPTTTGVSPFEYTQGGGRWSVDDMDTASASGTNDQIQNLPGNIENPDIDLQGFIDKIKEKGVEVSEAGRDAIDNLGDKLNSLLPDFFKNPNTTNQRGITKAIEDTKADLVSSGDTGLLDGLSGLSNKIKETATDIYSGLGDKTADVVATIKSGAADLFGYISNPVDLISAASGTPAWLTSLALKFPTITSGLLKLSTVPLAKVALISAAAIGVGMLGYYIWDKIRGKKIAPAGTKLGAPILQIANLSISTPASPNNTTTAAAQQVAAQQVAAQQAAPAARRRQSRQGTQGTTTRNSNRSSGKTNNKFDPVKIPGYLVNIQNDMIANHYSLFEMLSNYFGSSKVKDFIEDNILDIGIKKGPKVVYTNIKNLNDFTDSIINNIDTHLSGLDVKFRDQIKKLTEKLVKSSI